MNESSFKSKSISALKLSLLLACGAYLYSIINIGEVKKAMGDVGPFTIFTLLIILVLQEISTSLSLRRLVSGEQKLTLWEALSVDAMGLIGNTFLPTRAGSVVTVPVLLNNIKSISYGMGVQAVSIQMVYLSCIYAPVTLLGVSYLLPIFPRELIPVYYGAGAIYAIVPLIALLGHRFNERILSFLPSKLSSVSGVLTSKIPKKDVLLASLPYLFFYILVPVRFGIISDSLNVSLGPLMYAVVPILAYSVTIYPVSFGGVGIAEASGATILTIIGVNPSLAATVILVDRVFSAYARLAFAYMISSMYSIST